MSAEMATMCCLPQLQKGLCEMIFEKRVVGAVCVACGATPALNGAHPNIECKPRIEFCAPTAMHSPDMPHNDPSPLRTTGFVTVAGSTVTMASLGLPNVSPFK